MNRRDFLRFAGKAGGAAAIASSPLLNSCKGGPVAPDDPIPPKPVPVNLQFDIYNHTQGLQASFSESNILSNSDYLLRVPDLISRYGIRNVDPNRIAVRNDNFWTPAATYSRLGSTKLKVPDKDTNFDIFLFNNGGGIWLYDWLDALAERWPANERKNMYRRNFFSFYRRDYDGLTGEERVWGGAVLPETGEYGVFDQLNSTLKPNWAPFTYGVFNRKPNDTSGDSIYGYGSGYGHEYWKEAHSYVVVNPTRLTTIPQQVAGGIAAVIESLLGWENVGDSDTYRPIQTNGVLNQAGKDFITFMFVTDPTAKNIV